MTVWAEFHVEERILELLREVPGQDTDHHFGGPFVTGYQLAIALHARYPEIAQALGVPVGGAGVGQHNSLAQYLAQQLSSRIESHTEYAVEGAFIPSRAVVAFQFEGPDGALITSSASGSSYDLAIFRLRPP